MPTPTPLPTETTAARAKIILAMSYYDSLPKIARDIAKDFSIKEMNDVRKLLDIPPVATDEQWQTVRGFLDRCRAATQEDIYARGLAAY